MRLAIKKNSKSKNDLLKAAHDQKTFLRGKNRFSMTTFLTFALGQNAT